jgi:hypothetical protein
VSGRDRGTQGGQYDDAAQRGYRSQGGSQPPPGWDDQVVGHWQAPGEHVGPNPGGSSRGAPGSGYGQPVAGSGYYPDYGRPAAGSSYGQAAPGYGQSTSGYDQPASGYDQPLPGQGDPWYGQQQAPGYQQMPPGMAYRSHRAHSRRLLARIGVPSVIVIVAAVIAAVLLTGGHQGTQYPEASKTAAQILADMRAAAASPNETVHVVGTFKQKDQTIDLDVHSAGAARGYGTLRLKNYSMRIVVVNSTAYFTGSAGFWRASGAPARRARALAGKWVQTSASTPEFKQIAQLVLLDQLARQLKPTGTAVKVRGVTDVNGTPAVAVRDSSDGSLLYVAVRGPVLPLRVTGPHGQGAINFTGYGKPVTVTAPHAAISVP